MSERAAPGPSHPPSRRSGRIPALPYPPPGSLSISDEKSSGMNNILNAAHSVTNHAGQFCHHSPRRHSIALTRVRWFIEGLRSWPRPAGALTLN
jgi:hypothetical protein